MEVETLRDHEVAIAGDKPGPLRHQLMQRHLPHVEQARQQLPFEFGAPAGRLITRQSARGGGPQVRQRRQHIPRSRSPLHRGMDLPVHPAVHGVNQPIPLPAPGVGQKGRGEKSLSRGGEDHIDRVVHSAGDQRFDTPVGAILADHMGRLRHQRRPAWLQEGLFGPSPFRPIEATVVAPEGSVHVVRAAGERLALVPLFAFLGDSIAVAIGELPQAGWGGHVQRALVPKRPLGKHHPVGEQGPRVENSIAIGVDQPDNLMGGGGQLAIHLLVAARRIGDIQTPLFVEVSRDGAGDQRRPGDQLPGEAGGNLERRRRRLSTRRGDGIGPHHGWCDRPGLNGSDLQLCLG